MRTGVIIIIALIFTLTGYTGWHLWRIPLRAVSVLYV